jgi:hypothetical protein
MILTIEKKNDPIVQRVKQTHPHLYEALRKSDRLDVPLTEVHGFGVSGDVFVQDDAFPPMCMGKDLRLDLIVHSFVTVPTGADFKADIRKRDHGNSILKAQLVFPAGFSGVIERSEFGIDTFKRDEVLICDMKQIGSTVAGNNMTIFMYFTVL